jgi:hypothetical protein
MAQVITLGDELARGITLGLRQQIVVPFPVSMGPQIRSFIGLTHDADVHAPPG